MGNVYKKLISYGKEKKHFLFLTIVFSVFAAFLQVLAFYHLYKLLENVILLDDMSNAKRYAFLIAGFLAGGGLLYFLSLILSHLFAFRIETNLRKFGIDGLTNASFKFFDLNSSGRIRKLIDDNAAQTHMAVAHLIPDNTGAMITPVLVLVLGFFISYRVGIVLVVMTAVSLVLLKYMMGEQQFMKIYQASLEKLSSETVEYIRGMQVVKIFGVDVRSFKALNTAIKEYAQNALNYSLSCKTPYVLFQELFFGVVAILIPVILLFTKAGSDLKLMSLELIMVFFLSGVLYTYIMKVMYLSMYTFQAQDAVSKLENMYKDMQEDVLQFGDKTEFKNHNIEFENVSFGYKKDNLILENLSFKLEENKSYALVGASGSGKTTIAKLISGFYNVNDGEIKIGGENITSYSKEALINEISFVFQDSKLFKTTIYENVALANKDVSRKEVFEAMRLAGVDGIIAKFKDRENTVIGSKGVYLSGGEKQRVAIARAILKDAKIVIFDEASAAIDPDNEHELQKAFSNLMKEKTVIMIAHRLTSIRNVDEILVMENGKIIERGSDEELIKKDSVYKHFQDTYKTANDWRVADESVH
ncbi:MAG TPA: ABC transporter ATP-binding protein [Clostridia bacterium]|nr:ABC transporter ATP-binding protein [Clostridia bacterium]HOR90160.1 ABC transporter ATP-binding protein [Clostridia bacterium]HPL08461.1 ABC transporter ATP-binding protein [Clostridia bacterium]